MALAFARKLVSKKKKRFVSKEEGFDLDLTCTRPRAATRAVWPRRSG